MIYNSVIKIKREDAEEFEKLLGMEEIDLHSECIGKYETIANYSAYFENKSFIEFEICASTDDVALYPVFYEGGTEINLDVEDFLLGEHKYEFDDDTYVVLIESL